jgi:crotonobetainyl-CoA:carnitine CoA-transferase CaiB-like acyl-CoA transferase
MGDPNRNSGPPFIDGESPYFWTVNYDKQSIELDLTTDAGKDAFYDLVEKADVVVQNFRPGVAEKLNVDYETIRERNAKIIYCAISAFGQTGPWRQRPGYDLLVQGVSGIMSVTGEADGRPVKVGLPITDLITGMWGAFAIVTALYKRELMGSGEYIDLAMLDAVLPWLTKQAGKVFAGESPGRMGTKDPVLAPYQTFETANGFLNVACLTPKLWRAFCEAVDREDLLNDERFETNANRVEHMTELEAEIESTMIEHSTDRWMSILVDAGVPAAPVQDIESALSNEQVKARNMIDQMERSGGDDIPVIEHPINFSHSESGFESPPPHLGEDTYEVFHNIGYSQEAIDKLKERGAFGT